MSEGFLNMGSGGGDKPQKKSTPKPPADVKVGDRVQLYYVLAEGVVERIDDESITVRSDNGRASGHWLGVTRVRKVKRKD